MLNNTSLSRLSSQLSITFRGDKESNFRGIDKPYKLTTLYDAGHKILLNHRNEGYNIIKLLETKCLERWNILGNSKSVS